MLTRTSPEAAMLTTSLTICGNRHSPEIGQYFYFLGLTIIMGYFTWCALPFFLEAAGSGHRPTKYSLCTACAVLPRKESICILLAWQHNKETSMSPLLRPMKIWRSIWTTLMISTCLSSRILKKSPCSRFFNLMLKNYFVTWWAESCSSDFSTFPLLLDSTTPSQWSLNTKRQKNPPSTKFPIWMFYRFSGQCHGLHQD